MTTKRSSKKVGKKEIPDQNTASSDVKQEVVTTTTVPEPAIILPAPEIDLSNLFFLTEKGNLLPLKNASILSGSKPVQDNYDSADEMQDLLLKNKGILFGEDTLLINERKEKYLEPLGIFQFDGILFDFRDIAKPKLYMVKIALAGEEYFKLFFRITDYFAFLRHPEALHMLYVALSTTMVNNQGLWKELQEKIGNKDINEFLTEAFKRKPNILLVMEDKWKDLSEYQETYCETWGQMVMPLVISKYSSNGDTLVTVQPDFDYIRFGTITKTAKVKRETENSHFVGVSESVKEVYFKIKEELLIEDNALLFSPKNYYISLKKNHMLAYFHVGKRKINLVVMSSFDETNKLIKHHEVKTLTASVQKFWGGYCCTIVLPKRA